MALLSYHALFPCLWVPVSRSLFSQLVQRAKSIREPASREFSISLRIMSIINVISNTAELQRQRKKMGEIKSILMNLLCCILLYRRLNRRHRTIIEPSQFFLVTAAIFNTRAKHLPISHNVPIFQTIPDPRPRKSHLNSHVMAGVKVKSHNPSRLLQQLTASGSRCLSSIWNETPNYIEPCPASGRDEELIYAAAEIIQRRSQV